MNSEISKANDTGDWGNNKEMNPMANSSVAEDPLLEDESYKEDTWREEDGTESAMAVGTAARKTPSTSDTTITGDPGRTPGKAEGVEDPEIEGNE